MFCVLKRHPAHERASTGGFNFAGKACGVARSNPHAESHAIQSRFGAGRRDLQSFADSRSSARLFGWIRIEGDLRPDGSAQEHRASLSETSGARTLSHSNGSRNLSDRSAIVTDVDAW